MEVHCAGGGTGLAGERPITLHAKPPRRADLALARMSSLLLVWVRLRCNILTIDE